MQNTRSLPTLAFISPHTLRILCSPAAFRLRNQEQQSSSVGASQTLGNGRSGAHGACSFMSLSGRPAWLSATSSWRPLIPARQRQTAPARSPWQAAPDHQLNRTAAATAAVVSIKHNAASVSRSNRPSTSHHFLATTSLLHQNPDNLTFQLLHSPIFLKTVRPSSSAVRHGRTPKPANGWCDSQPPTRWTTGQWRSIQGQYWVQHNIRHTLNKRRDSGWNR